MLDSCSAAAAVPRFRFANPAPSRRWIRRPRTGSISALMPEFVSSCHSRIINSQFLPLARNGGRSTNPRRYSHAPLTGFERRTELKRRVRMNPCSEVLFV
ncbi:hypothetical protein DAI22_10g032975 [Oryza sativa Japonica Group]|nr:hypothetical protein DAI22_10g032975 [Oryza sativa Japonica Group]